MTRPACYVIGGSEWDAAVSSVGTAFLLALVVVWAAGVDWFAVSDRLRLHLRRRRLNVIRRARG